MLRSPHIQHLVNYRCVLAQQKRVNTLMALPRVQHTALLQAVAHGHAVMMSFSI
jgi:hypothetical protein